MHRNIYTLILAVVQIGLTAAGVARAPSLGPVHRHKGLYGSHSVKPRTFSVDVVRNTAHQVNGPLLYTRALGKYGVDYKTHISAKFDMGLVSAFNQTNDREYLSPVYFGTPGQLCWMDFDTGSGDLWLYSSKTPSFYISGQQIYRPEHSNTSSPVANVSWDISYGDGSYAGGSVYRDTITVSNITMFNATVEIASTVSRSFASDPMSGILGLALNHTSTTFPSQPTFLDSLSPMMEENVFAVDLKYKDTGAYHFGYINQSSYQGSVSWQPVTPHSRFWQINLAGIHIGGDNVWRFYSWPMIADTGTTLLLLPGDLTSLYWSKVPGSFFSDEQFGWIFPCNATLPNFDFSFTDGWNATIPGHYLNFQSVQNATGAFCYGGIQDSMQDFGILGDAFLKALYVIFDIGGSRVGLANKILTA